MFGPNSRVPIRSTAVTCAVVRKNGRDKTGSAQVLVMRRTDPVLAGVWSLVTGHVDEGETAWQAGHREVIEETGLTPDTFYTANVCDQWYNHHANVIELVPIFVAFVHDGAEVSLNDEHSELKWLTFPDAIDHVPFHGHKRALEHIRLTFIDNDPPKWLKIEV